MVVVDGRGGPVGAQLASAQISEHQLAESTLEQVKVPRSGRGRPRSRLRRVIADRGYDSDPLRSRLKRRGTELIARNVCSDATWIKAANSGLSNPVAASPIPMASTIDVP